MPDDTFTMLPDPCSSMHARRALRPVEDALEVHRPDAVELRLVGRHRGAGRADAGDVRHHVEATVPRRGAGDERGDRTGVADVDGDGLGGGPDLGGGVLGARLVDVGAHDERAGAGEPDRALLADPARGAGDDGDAVAEVELVHVAPQ